MNIRSIATVWISFLFLVLLMPACDTGEPVEGVDTPVEANKTLVTLAPGSSTVVQISGGTPPYFISTRPSPTLASAALGDSTKSPVGLTITAAAGAVIGSSGSVSVADADEAAGGGAFEKTAHGDNEVTILINIGIGGLSFSGDVQPIFDARCATTGCHEGSMSPFGLSLESGLSYANLVNVTAGAPDCNGEPRVLPGDPDASVLYKRIRGTDCGSRMPWALPPIIDSLTTDEQNTIRDWIDDGALNN